MAAEDIHVLIIGAGITGLLLAQGLKKAGIRYTVFDSEASAAQFRPLEWGVTIHWSQPLLEMILPPELWSRKQEVQADPAFEADANYVIPFYNARSGQHLKDQPVPYAVRASRRKMRKLLTEGIDIAYGKELVELEFTTDSAHVRATFGDSSVATGTLVVGADGHRSTVRRLVLGRDKAKAQLVGEGYQLATIAACYHDAGPARLIRDLHPINMGGFHTSERLSIWIAIADAPSPDRPEDWTFQLMPSWPGLYDSSQTEEEKLAKLKSMTTDLAEPWKTAFNALPPDTAVPGRNLTAWDTVEWGTRGGRVVLAGDAAHAMPPHRGQGLNHSIQDVYNLLKALENTHDGTVEEAVNAYEAEVVKRGSDEVRTSIQSAILVHDFEKLMQAPVMKQGYVKAQVQ